MGRVKEMFIEAHEKLIEEYLEKHPGTSWEAAYDICADAAYGRMQDDLADRADAIRQRMKDEWK